MAQQDGVPAVRFENVGLTYKNAGAESLTDTNFTAYKGQTIGVIGGDRFGKIFSGKSDSPFFYDATRGRVLVCERM